MVEITDFQSAMAWLEGKPREVQVAFAARCALRALPSLDPTYPQSMDQITNLAEIESLTDVRPFGETAIEVLRALLAAVVASIFNREDLNATAHSAASAIKYPKSSVHYPARTAAHAAALVPTEKTPFSAAVAAIAPDTPSTYFAASGDIKRFGADTPDAVFRQSLWHGLPMPKGVQKAFSKLLAFWDADPETWGFWREWYQGMLDGQPMGWELQKRVALIPDEDWEKGPEHIARLIEEIRARFELEKRIAELEGELAVASRDRLGIGGNNPPEPIQEAPTIAKELVLIWEPLQELKQETDADDPDPSTIARLVGLLLTALKRGLGWCASKADLVVDTTIKWGIPAAGGGYLALNPDKLERVIQAAQAWQTALQNVLN